MKIICIVEVVNRNLQSLNLQNKKAARSSLTIGKDAGKNVFLFHQTMQSSSLTKYKLRENIANLFVKFINEGKATIRFKEPQHDLAIKCDPIQLKGFLKILKATLDGTVLRTVATVNENSPPCLKNIKPVKTKLKITSKNEYPVLEGFPRTLQQLTVNGTGQTTLDSRVLRLHLLTMLDLADNRLIALPPNFGACLRSLAELRLTGNHISDWRWLADDHLRRSLRLLDIASNEITLLPDIISKCINLVTLKLDNNALANLPNGIGHMRSLRYLSVSKNKLSCLPGSVVLLNLAQLDVSGNDFLVQTDERPCPEDFRVVPSLVDAAAKCVLSNRLEVSAEWLPRTLVSMLEAVGFCTCGTPCPSTGSAQVVRRNPSSFRRIDSVVVGDSASAGVIAISICFCSYRCYLREEALKP